jgi:dihydrofolate reductase
LTGTALDSLKEEEKVFIIGGGELYEQFLELADELHLTLVDNDIDGDVFFPPYEHLIGSRFSLVNEEKGDGCVFRDYTSRKKS